jgi:hypothetical protein
LGVQGVISFDIQQNLIEYSAIEGRFSLFLAIFEEFHSKNLDDKKFLK